MNLFQPVTRRLDAIEASLRLLVSGQASILQNQGKQMATLAEVQASQSAEDVEIKAIIVALQSAQASTVALSAQVAALQAQIAAGGAVTAADLDGLKAAADAQKAEIDAALTPAAPAPAAPAPAAPAPAAPAPAAPAP